jgi:hypothetical protein
VTKITRTAGSADAYQDVPFTYATAATYDGFLQKVDRPGDVQTEGGKEEQYDARLFLGSTATIDEDDMVELGGIRYHVVGLTRGRDGSTVDHFEVQLKKEVT